MTLVELHPRWLADAEGRRGMGISFDCPVHRDHRLAVFFVNPTDGGPPRADGNRWQRHGDDFASLTLGPSIDASGSQWPLKESEVQIALVHQPHPTPCWHGFIQHGEIVGGEDTPR
jgi:hypothetical protein